MKVNAIISQKASLKEWVLHINLVLKGVRTYSSHVVETMHRTPDFNSLKYDEFSVLSYIAQGVTLENVANLMSRGIKTIEVRRTKGMRKLGMRHYAELIAIKNILKDENFRLTMAMW
ncbi:DNA-binding transcriptional activator BglJ [compost metagenome]